MCYPTYYNLIIDTISGKINNGVPSSVTLSGTPQIGKSLFYHYFINRLMGMATNGLDMELIVFMNSVDKERAETKLAVN